MRSLSLLGIHTDGEHLVLVDTEGERFLLPLDEELRSIVRQQRRKVVAALSASNTQDLRPKDIQTLIRGGASAQEVATSAGMDLAQVKRYEAPVLAERIYTARQAQETRVSPDKDAPALGELVIDRLATRGVSPTSLIWDATRQPGENWLVHLEFVQDAKALEANWDFDHENRTLTALDEQARWLTETATPAGSDTLLSRGHFRFGSAPETEVSPSPTTKPIPEQSPETSATEALLEELNAARGTRLSVVTGDEEDDVSAMEAAIASGFAPDAETAPPAAPTPDAVSPLPDADVLSLEAAKLQSPPAAQSPALPTDSGVLPGMEDLQPNPAQPAADTGRHTTRRGRAAMPSWDEILFGSKAD